MKTVYNFKPTTDYGQIGNDSVNGNVYIVLTSNNFINLVQKIIAANLNAKFVVKSGTTTFTFHNFILENNGGKWVLYFTFYNISRFVTIMNSVANGIDVVVYEC